MEVLRAMLISCGVVPITWMAGSTVQLAGNSEAHCRNVNSRYVIDQTSTQGGVSRGIS